MCYFVHKVYLECGCTRKEYHEFCAAASYAPGGPYACGYELSDGFRQQRRGKCRDCQIAEQQAIWDRQTRMFRRRQHYSRAYRTAVPRNRNAYARLAPQTRQTDPFWNPEYCHNDDLDNMPNLFEDEVFSNQERPLTRHRKPGHLGAWMDYEPPVHIQPLP